MYFMVNSNLTKVKRAKKEEYEFKFRERKYGKD